MVQVLEEVSMEQWSEVAKFDFSLTFVYNAMSDDSIILFFCLFSGFIRRNDSCSNGSKISISF